MSDLNSDIRRAIDTGSVAIGNRESMRSISEDKAKAVVIASNGKQTIIDDMIHVCNVANIRIIKFEGNSLELGAICGKPYSVNSLAIMEPGNSNILNESYA